MTMPTDNEMPSAIAELMGWEKVHDSCHGCFSGKGLIAHVNPVYTESALGAFRPMTDRNHSRLAVERCAELGLKEKYMDNLINDNIRTHEHPFRDWKSLAFATPAQETRAAYKTLFEHQQQKDAADGK